MAPKQKEKPAAEKTAHKKAAPAANGAAGLLANAYNPLSGTFHSMESGGPESQENGGFNMFEGGPGHGDASDSDSDDEKDEANGEEKRTAGGTLVSVHLVQLWQPFGEVPNERKFLEHQVTAVPWLFWLLLSFVFPDKLLLHLLG